MNVCERTGLDRDIRMQRVLGSLLTGVKANFILEVLHGSGVVDDDLQRVGRRVSPSHRILTLAFLVHLDPFGIRTKNRKIKTLIIRRIRRRLRVQTDHPVVVSSGTDCGDATHRVRTISNSALTHRTGVPSASHCSRARDLAAFCGFDADLRYPRDMIVRHRLSWRRRRR